MEKQALKEFDKNIKNLTKKDTIVLCPDLDADGISAGAITYIALKQIIGKNPIIVIQPYKTTQILPSTLKKIKKNKANKLVIVDFAFDQSKENAQSTEKKFEKIIVIDHHTDYKTKLKKTFIIKPQHITKIDPSKYPASKFCYDLFSRHTNLEKISWIASVGLIGDNQLKQWKKFVKKTAKKHNTTITEISKVTSIISATESMKPKKLKELLMLIVKAKNPKEIIKSKFSAFERKFKKESNKLLKEFMKKKEVHKKINLIWFEFFSKKNLKSELINRASNEYYPNKTIIVVQDIGNKYLYFSARRQDFKIKMNELLEKAVKNLEKAGAGGHVPAAAGKIMKKDLAKFKNKVIEILSKNN
ncbi:MAG: DHHA1 domain-containing protein [Candidatus Diapherotrites archaeon]